MKPKPMRSLISLFFTILFLFAAFVVLLLLLSAAVDLQEKNRKDVWAEKIFTVTDHTGTKYEGLRRSGTQFQDKDGRYHAFHGNFTEIQEVNK